MSAPAFRDYRSSADLAPDPDLDFADAAARFDDSDGAYAVAEPDPFAEPVPAAPRRPSLRAELGARPAVPVAGLAQRSMLPLPVPDGLSTLLPHGLRRGSTIAITGSVSLLLALLAGPSGSGAWTAMVGLPAISAEAATEAGLELRRVAVIGPPGGTGGTGGIWAGSAWTTAVGALLDAVDVVVAQPGSTLADGDARRLGARARTKGAVLVLFGHRAGAWPSVEVTLSARHDRWSGIGEGYGRLVRRRLLVSATGKGSLARPRTDELWV